MTASPSFAARQFQLVLGVRRRPLVGATPTVGVAFVLRGPAGPRPAQGDRPDRPVPGLVGRWPAGHAAPPAGMGPALEEREPEITLPG
jgi:hypothetical protein